MSYSGGTGTVNRRAGPIWLKHRTNPNSVTWNIFALRKEMVLVPQYKFLSLTVRVLGSWVLGFLPQEEISSPLAQRFWKGQDRTAQKATEKRVIMVPPASRHDIRVWIWRGQQAYYGSPLFSLQNTFAVTHSSRRDVLWRILQWIVINTGSCCKVVALTMQAE